MRGAVTSVSDDQPTDKEILLLFTGLALTVLGTGLILSNRHIRQALLQIQQGTLLDAAVPDIERDLQLRAM